MSWWRKQNKTKQNKTHKQDSSSYGFYPGGPACVAVTKRRGPLTLKPLVKFAASAPTTNKYVTQINKSKIKLGKKKKKTEKTKTD